VAVVVEAVLSLAADEEETTEEEIAVDVTVLVADAIFGVVDVPDAAAALDAEVAVDAHYTARLRKGKKMRPFPTLR
jgi:hypothetical protein